MKCLLLFLLMILGGLNLPVKASELQTQLRGTGTYRWFFLDVYDAQLWGPIVNNFYDHPLSLELKYKRNFKGDEIMKQTIQELVSAGVDLKINQGQIDELKKIIPDVQKGDSLRANYWPQKGLQFTLNSTKDLGLLKDKEFSKLFLEYKQEKKTSDPVLRDKLLGKKQ